MSDPGPFGWVGALTRWSSADAHVVGQGGPLPPPKAKANDTTDGDIYQGLADGWLHGTVGAALSSFFSEPRTRKELYVLFEKMDMTDHAGSVLDLFAEDSTQPHPDTGRRIWVESSNEAIVSATDALFHRLQTEDEITALTRDLCKFGDNFERLVYRSGFDGGVRRMLPTPPLSVTRKEGKDGNLLGYMQSGKKFRNDNKEVSYAWDFAHFRLRGRDRRYPYGTSVLHNAIRPWKSLIVMEDWMIGYHTAKHPDRYMLLLDVGTASDHEAMDITQRVKQKFRKHIVMDPGGSSSRNMRQSFDSHSPMQDIVLPIRQGSSTQLTRMAGSNNATDIAPIGMLTQRFFSAVRAPKEFFGFADGTTQPTNPKATLTNQDIRYARTVKRIQQSVVAGYRYLAEFNLMLLMAPGDQVAQDMQGIDLSGLDFRIEGNDFAVKMSPVSFLDELEMLEVAQTRQQVAIAMMELSMNNPAIDILQWTDYILREIVKVPDDNMLKIIRQDLEMQHIDNMGMGLLPNGQPVPEAPPAKTARESALRKIMSRMTLSERTALTDKPLTQEGKVALSEAIMRNPALRKSIYLGKRLFENVHQDIPFVGALPNNELIKKGLIKDTITEEEYAAIVAEARKEVGVTGADDGDAD